MHPCQDNFEKSYAAIKKQTNKLSIRFLVIQSLQVVCFTQQKTNLIVTKVNIGWKFFAKT